jgi:hypothetical protein
MKEKGAVYKGFALGFGALLCVGSFVFFFFFFTAKIRFRIFGLWFYLNVTHFFADEGMKK